MPEEYVDSKPPRTCSQRQVRGHSEVDVSSSQGLEGYSYVAPQHKTDSMKQTCLRVTEHFDHHGNQFKTVIKPMSTVYVDVIDA